MRWGTHAFSAPRKLRELFRQDSVLRATLVDRVGRAGAQHRGPRIPRAIGTAFNGTAREQKAPVSQPREAARTSSIRRSIRETCYTTARVFCGFKTQCPSSGYTSSFDGTFCKLQRGEKLQALRVGNAIIHVRHESPAWECGNPSQSSWATISYNVSGLSQGVPLNSQIGNQSSSVAPNSLRRSIDAGVRNQGLEALGMAEHPIDHVAAIGSAGRGHAIRVGIRQSDHVIHRSHDVVIRLSRPNRP